MKVNRRALVSVLAMVITFVLGMGLQANAAQYLDRLPGPGIKPGMKKVPRINSKPTPWDYSF